MVRPITAGGSAVLLITATLFADLSEPAGPEVVFTGRVTAAETGEGLAGAEVRLDRTEHRTRSRSDGSYRLAVPEQAVGSGEVTLLLSMSGYEEGRISVTVGGPEIRRDLSLRALPTRVTRVVVAAQEESRAAARAETGRGAADLTSSVPHSAPPPPAPAGAQFQFRAYPGSPPPRWNTEEYDHRVDNGFVAVAQQPLSTFSIDVDRASYGNVRRFLMEGQRPPEDAVRVEELINYFPYAYPEPRGRDPVSITVETGEAPWRAEHRLVRIGVRSRDVAVADLPPSNLVFLIDVSGSMAGPDRLPLVKSSLRMLVDQLRERDRVAIVVYAGAAGLVLPSTPGSQRERILGAIEGLEAGGSTAGGAGLRLAYEIARENHLPRGNNRVILATDGDFNVGTSSTGEMVRLIEERREQGTHLTVLGFGRGNLNDSMMEQIAHHGNGNYSYIDSLLEARKALVEEMGGTLLTVASDVKLQVEFNPERVTAYRLIGYENRLLANEDFNDDSVDAGEIGAGHTVTAVYEIVPVGVQTDVVRGVDPLRYGGSEAPAPAGQDSRRSRSDGSGEIAYVKIRYKAPGEESSRLLERPILDPEAAPSADLTFVSAVIGFGMLLRDSEHRGDLTGREVLELARAGRGADSRGYRAEFARLVELYLELPDSGHAHGGR